MGEADRAAERIVVEVCGGGAHAELLPREIHRVRAVAQSHFQTLPVSGGGDQLEVVTNNPV